MKVRYNRQNSREIDLVQDKIYEVLSVEKGWYRIIDEDPNDFEEPRGYLYPPELFDIVEE